MRRIWTSTNRNLVDQCCQELSSHEIPYTLDSEKDLDWGSDAYGTVFFSIWTHDDADVERAKALLEQVVKEPEDTPIVIPNASINSPLQQFLQQRFHLSFSKKPKHTKFLPLATLALFFLCVILYAADHNSIANAPTSTSPYSSSFTASPMRQAMLFDYPEAFILENSLLNTYGPDSLNLSSKLNESGTALRNQFLATPYWGGLYTEVLNRFTKRDAIPTPSLSVSLLGERIRDGQLWRMITPCFFHGDIFHLVFNLMWLIALGTQIERRIHSLRFLLLLTIIAVVSNTAQYLMTGPNFLGISGVICGMVGFIAARQRFAPWESYHFSQMLYSCFLFFILTLVVISGAEFFVESYLHTTFALSFANTAHLSGLAIGLVAGRWKWFSEAKSSMQSAEV